MPLELMSAAMPLIMVRCRHDIRFDIYTCASSQSDQLKSLRVSIWMGKAKVVEVKGYADIRSFVRPKTTPEVIKVEDDIDQLDLEKELELIMDQCGDDETMGETQLDIDSADFQRSLNEIDQLAANAVKLLSEAETAKDTHDAELDGEECSDRDFTKGVKATMLNVSASELPDDSIAQSKPQVAEHTHVSDPNVSPAQKKTEQQHADVAITSTSLSKLVMQARPLCSKCNWECDPTRSQIKGAGKWICNRCNSRQVMLNKMVGHWPNDEFKSLPLEEQQKFWQESRDLNGAEVKFKVIETLARRRTDAITSKLAGTYLPLSVYEKQGFDVKLIEDRCKDHKEHPVLGLVYRVPLESLERSQVEAKIREQLLSAFSKAAKRDREAGSEDDAQAASAAQGKKAKHTSKAESESDSSNSDNESTSDSDSSSDHKKKKEKKGMKHKKQNKKSKKSKKSKDRSPSKKKDKGDKKKNKKGDAGNKAQKDKDKLQQKELADKVKAGRKIHTQALKVLTQVSHPIWQLEQVMGEKLFSKVPSFAAGAVKTAHKDLLKIRAEATTKKGEKPEAVKELSFSMGSVASLAKSALEHSSVATNMMAAAAKYE